MVATVAEVVAERRIHARNRGVVEKGLRADYVRLAKALLDRKKPPA